MTQKTFMQQRELLQQHVNWSQLSMPKAEERAVWSQHFPLERLERSGTVISGPNCAGKTTLAEALRKRGIEALQSETRVVNDKATDAVPRVIARMNNDVLNQTAASHHLETIQALSANPESAVVFDRGLGDIHGMLRLFRCFSNPVVRTFGRPLRGLFSDPAIRETIGSGLGCPEAFEQATKQLRCIEEWSKIIRYRRVLILESLPSYHGDGIRTEDQRLSTVLGWFIRNSWRKLGYTPIKVPPYVNDIEGRADRVLEIIGRNTRRQGMSAA